MTKRYHRWVRGQTLKSWVLDRLRGAVERRLLFDALHDVSFAVPRGQWVGIIGANGAGKSTLLNILAGTVVPDEGSVCISGRVSPLLQLGAGFNHQLTGRRNVFLYGTLLGMSRREVQEKFDSIVDFSGVQEFIDTPVKYYSSGMYVRLAFAVAAHTDPEVVLLDEVLAVGDLAYQKKCVERLRLFRQQGRTIALVTQSLDDVDELCDRALLLDHGRILADGNPRGVCQEYRRLVGGAS